LEHSQLKKWVKPSKHTVYYRGSNETYNAYLVSADFHSNQRTVFVVTTQSI